MKHPLLDYIDRAVANPAARDKLRAGFEALLRQDAVHWRTRRALLQQIEQLEGSQIPTSGAT